MQALYEETFALPAAYDSSTKPFFNRLHSSGISALSSIFGTGSCARLRISAVVGCIAVPSPGLRSIPTIAQAYSRRPSGQIMSANRGGDVTSDLRPLSFVS